MLTFEDCVGHSGLTEDEIAAISEHEHVPEMVACELGSSLLRTRAGVHTIRRYMEDDIVMAELSHKAQKARHWQQTLHQFVGTHGGR